MEFFRQEYWSRLPFPTPGNLPDPNIQPTSPESPALAGRFFTTALPGEPWLSVCYLSEDAKLRISFSITWAALSLDCSSLDLSLVDKSLLYQGLYLVKLFCCYLLAYQEIGFIIHIFFISFVFASFLSNLKLNREEKIVPAVLFMK